MTTDTFRVWMVNHYADAPDGRSGTRHFDLARQLVGRGRRVTIFASGFSHVTQREERLHSWRPFRSETIAGVEFVWIRTFPYHGNTWRRYVNMLSFAATFLVVQTRFASPNAVIGSTVHPFAALSAWMIARARRARYLFEIRDLWPQTLVDLGAMTEGSATERVLRGIEAFLVRRASAVIALLPGVPEYLRGRGLPSKHVWYIPNGVDIEAFDSAVAAEPSGSARTALDTIDQLRRNGRFVVGYVGSFGRVNRLDVVINAALTVEARAPGRISVVLVGDGPERAVLAAMTSSEAVTILPAIPKSSVPIVMQSLDAAVLHLTTTPVFRFGVSPNKLFEYMAARRPIVFACESAYDPIAVAGAGVTVRPDDPVALADALASLASATADERERMGSAGRAYAEREHSVRVLGGRLDALVAGLNRPARDDHG